MEVRSGLSGGEKTGVDSSFDSTCGLFLSNDHAGFVGVEDPGVNREDVEPLHAPKPPEETVTGEADDVGVSNEAWPKVGVDPNPGCPKVGVDFIPRPVCPNPGAGFGLSCCGFDGDDVSGLA